VRGLHNNYPSDMLQQLGSELPTQSRIWPLSFNQGCINSHQSAMEASYDLVFHENYGISDALVRVTQRSTKAPDINNVSGILSLALELGIPILNESGNSRLDRTNLAAGASSKTSIFKLQDHLGNIENNATYGGKLVVSKHVPKGLVESENQRYDALVRDILFLSHDPIAQHDRFVNIIAIGWEDAEDIIQNRIWPVLLLELAEYGTLEEFFDLDDTDKSWGSKQAICRDVAAGLDWLHKCRIVHSDVKFANVLIFRDGDGHRAKISDFGFALDVDALEATGVESAQLDGFSPPCAPEAASLIPLNLLTKFDVFSYGLLVGRTFLNGEVLGETQHDLDLANEFERDCVKLGLYNDEQRQLVKTVIFSTTSADPKSRIDINEVLNMTLLKTNEVE
jgi:serine/threonine protein kinase